MAQFTYTGEGPGTDAFGLKFPAGVVVEALPPDWARIAPGVPAILVPDTLVALGRIAEVHITADDGLDAGGARRLIKLDQAKQVTEVG